MIDLKWLTTYMAITHALSYNVIMTVLHHLFFYDKKVCNTVMLMTLQKCTESGLFPYATELGGPYWNVWQTGDLIFYMDGDTFRFTTTLTIENSTSLMIEKYDGTTVFSKEGFPVSPAEFFTAINKVIV